MTEITGKLVELHRFLNCHWKFCQFFEAFRNSRRRSLKNSALDAWNLWFFELSCLATRSPMAIMLRDLFVCWSVSFERPSANGVVKDSKRKIKTTKSNEYSHTTDTSIQTQIYGKNFWVLKEEAEKSWIHDMQNSRDFENRFNKNCFWGCWLS